MQPSEHKGAVYCPPTGAHNAPPSRFSVVSTQNLKGGAKIEAGRLYVKADHRRDDELGPTLKSGTVGVKLIERCVDAH